MTILVTGATGFTGSALLRSPNNSRIHDIVGLARSAPSGAGWSAGIRILPCDLLDRSRLHAVIADTRPERVIHLAGLNRGALKELFSSNVTGTENLLDALRETNPACRILIVSSSAVYGYTGTGPIGEEAPMRPLTDYAKSKAEQERIAREQHTGGSLVTIARPFNLIGPGQPDAFLCGRIVRQVVEIEHGEREHLELFETRSYRDFIDVRDAVRVYWALVSHPNFERECAGRVFNIGSGTAYSVSDVISLVEEITGRTYVVEMPEDPPVVPVPYQQADISRIRAVTGWKPVIPLKEALVDMLEAERKRMAGKSL